MITIRRLDPKDQPEWLRMRLALWPGEAEAHKREMETLARDPTVAVFVAAHPDGRLGGFVEVGTRKYADGCDSSPVGYLEGWYVDPDLRRQGLGGRLVQTAEEWVRSLGLREIASDTWLENQTSLQAHLALGFEETERLIHFRKALD